MHSHFSKGLEKLAVVERVTPLVTRVMGYNPGRFTLQGTNTYLVGSGAERILVDTGEGRPEFVSTLQEYLAAEPAKIGKVVLTHWHPDHIGGLADVLGSGLTVNAAPVYKMPETHHDRVAFAKIGYDPSGLTAISNGDTIATEGATLRAVHTPGHTKDCVCLLLEEENSIFTSDIVLGTGSSHFSDLSEYMASLSTLLDISRSGTGQCRLYPSHGPVIADGEAKIKEYISHRNKRDEELIDLVGKHGATPMLAMDLVQQMYQNVPADFHKAAESNVILHLLRLEKRGLVAAVREPGSDASPHSLGGQTPPEELHDIMHLVLPNLKTKWHAKTTSPL
ncbi:Beta-lactamase-like protein 2-like protein [Diplonema papillatum]|nr:Beta-lactamase-like protein 2-like protein [Diplonema papillatum]